MTSWFLLSCILGFSLGLSSRKWILTPSVFRCNETEIILIHTFSGESICLRLQLKSGINQKVINDTGKVEIIEKKNKFELGVFNDDCINDYVYLYITSYMVDDNAWEGSSDMCDSVPDKNPEEYKIPVQKNVGYIFIQTDLPIYHPNDLVQIQIFRLNENMYPENASVVMNIKDPSNSVMKSQIFHDKTYVISTSFQLENHSSQVGEWTISVDYTGKRALKETNIRFLVQEYVMPKFEVEIDVQPKLIFKNTNFVNVTITAMYFYNKTVDGKVYLNYGNNGDRISGKLKDGHFFQQVEITGERCGAFHISAKVIERNSRMTEYKTDSTANFVNSNSIPNNKKTHEKQSKSREMRLTIKNKKEYYMQGTMVEVTVENCQQIHYCVIGRGRIARCGMEIKHSVDVPMISFHLTEDMIPLAELITYCVEDKKINSTASLIFKILDICSNKKRLKVDIIPKKESYLPKENVTLRISGSQGQSITLSLVDDAVHVISNRYRLTTNFVRKKLLAHHMESFANLKMPNKDLFPMFGYDIHETNPRKTTDDSKTMDSTENDNIEANSENDDYIVRLPEPMFRRSELNVPDVFKYNYFPASLLFKTFYLNSNGVLDVNVLLPDTLTRWNIQAVSLSKNSPFCVYKPKSLITFKHLVSRLHVPQNVQKYGMFEIKFILYNYYDQNLKVNITLNKTKHICAKANNIIVNVQPLSSTVRKFVAYAMKTGNVPISITIAYKDVDVETVETIEKSISIQDYEVSKPKILTFFLEKTDGFEDSAVSGMTCNERTVLGDIVSTTLQEPEKLMQKSQGSGSQNIIYMAMSVYVLKYISNTKQMNREIYDNGTKFIRMGIEKQKYFQRNDGSYSTYSDTKSSVWLTAFVLKVFCQASEFEEIDEELTRQSVFWLLRQQKLDGNFEDTSYEHTDIMGGRSTLELTAFVLISLMECRQIHAKEIYTNEERITLSMKYLEKNVNDINDALTLAITTYALTLTISDKRLSAWNSLFTNFPAWKEQNSLRMSKSESVLVASYALLTQLQYDDITIAFSIFNWLIEQKDKNGMFSSTQNTVIALQALAEYAIKWNAPDLGLRILRPTGNHNVKEDLTIDKTTFLKKNNLESSTEKQIKITSIGVRSTYVQVLTDYNIFNAKQENCHFDISYVMKKKSAKQNSTHGLNITFKYNGNSSMKTPVMELDLLSGFYMDKNEFEMMQSHNDINKLEENGESVLTFFLRKLEPGEKLTLNLTLRRGNERKLSPSSINIYNYERPDENCVILYPKEKYYNLFCSSNKCLCSEGCPLTKHTTAGKLTKIFCKPNQIGIKVKILKKKNNLGGANKARRLIYIASINYLLNGSPVNPFGYVQRDNRTTEVIIDKDCQTISKGEYVIATDKYIETKKGYKFLIDQYGFIKKVQNEVLNFEQIIRGYSDHSCTHIRGKRR